MADSVDDFEFKPLTDGLGFHKKAEKIKDGIRNSGIAEDRTARFIPDSPSSLFGDQSQGETPRAASQSISELIAQLPPSLDFLEDRSEPEAASEFTPAFRSWAEPRRKERASVATSPLAASRDASEHIPDDPMDDLISEVRGEVRGSQPQRPQFFEPLPRSSELRSDSRSDSRMEISPSDLSRPDLSRPDLSRPEMTMPSAGMAPASMPSGTMSPSASSTSVSASSGAGAQASMPPLSSPHAVATRSEPTARDDRHQGRRKGKKNRDRDRDRDRRNQQNAAATSAPRTQASAATGAAKASGVGAASSYNPALDESFARSFPKSEIQNSRANEPQSRGSASAADTRAHAHSEESSQLVAVAAHFPSAILDGMVALGISTLFLVCILVITQVNLVGMLSNAQTDVVTQVQLVLLYVAVLQLYVLTSRGIFGATLGEWSFDLQLGNDAQQKSIWYPLQVLWRSLLMTATGLILFPLLSFVSGRDLAKYLTGLQLYRRAQ